MTECYYCKEHLAAKGGICLPCRRQDIHRLYRVCGACETLYPLSSQFFDKGSKSNGGFCHTCRTCRRRLNKEKTKTGSCIDCQTPVQITSKRCHSCNMKYRNTGENNPMWKGGRTIAHGYYYLRKDKKSVPEHRIVMSNFLDRPLEDHEIVHHKNGDKLDNRIENLELCSNKRQPPGQRIIDLVDWAQQILEEYSDEAERLRNAQEVKE